ncbi:DUF3592 domain-containing protein [Actinoplanes sp. NPDC051494]|uniref:DUF3592 domain-containing protein n=1 Tax=Actinoplanes sp. NPDC051494 TaxID=3363907 RepID=UPI00378A2B3E
MPETDFIGDGGGFATLVSALVVGFPALVGLALVAFGIRTWLRTRTLATEGVQAIAVVVDNQHESRTDGEIIFRPVVQFRTMDGREITTALENAPSRRSHIAGRQVTVAYDPQNPERANGTGETGSRSGGGIVAIIAGTVFIGFAIVAYLLVTAMTQASSDFFGPDFAGPDFAGLG